MNKISLLIILSFFTCLSFAQQTRNLKLVKPPTANPTTQTRKAMVIGMSDYGAGKNLNNTLNDADDMADVLTRLGFQVTLLKNNDLRNLKTNLANWYYTIEGNDMAIFYFAGHGMEVNGENYLIPVEAELNSQTDVEFNALNVNQVLGNMDEKRVGMKLLILDACRDNPFKRSWSRGSEVKGLAQMRAPKGTYIAFAASPGATAMDGGNYDLNNGVFTYFLKQEILKAGASIDEIFNNVTGRVATKTHDQQMPFKNSSLAGNFYFIPPGNDKPILPSAPAIVVKGELKVNSTPEQDAIIMIDGIRQTEKTPATFQLDAGSYRVVVSKEWYKEALREVPITGGQITEINVPLMPNFATITIHAAGNEKISVDGVLRAFGNWQGKLKTGLHTLVVEKESHKSYKSTINVQAGNDQSLEIPALEPIYGTLNIATGNINATVYIDGVERSSLTPCVIKNVLIGKRLIQLIPDDSNCQPYETVADISEGEITTVSLDLNKPQPVLDLNKPQPTSDLNRPQPTINDGIEMVFVQGGTFTMGCTYEQDGDCKMYEKPVHQVQLSDFYIGKYEVTQAQWKAVMGNNPSKNKGDNLPVENVSWKDVQEFIRKLNTQTGKQYRLPTEAEWEYACRGGKHSAHYKYSGSNIVGDVAWYIENSSSVTHIVGTKSPNELGLYDMSGNVGEWCSDWFDTYKSNPQSSPQGPAWGSWRVIRGGSWINSVEDVRVSSRNYGEPNKRYNSIGFRLACSSNNANAGDIGKGTSTDLEAILVKDDKKTLPAAEKHNIAPATSTREKVKIGLRAGVNLSKLMMEEEDSDIGFGFQAGLVTWFPMMKEKLYIQTGILFSQLGAKYIDDDWEYSIVMNYNYIQIPINFQYRENIVRTALLLQTGPYLGYGIGGKYEWKESYHGDTDSGSEDIKFGYDREEVNPFDFGWHLGIGLLINKKFQINIGSNIGLSNMSNYERSKTKNLSVMFTLSYMFGK